MLSKYLHCTLKKRTYYLNLRFRKWRSYSKCVGPKFWQNSLSKGSTSFVLLLSTIWLKSTFGCLRFYLWSNPFILAYQATYWLRKWGILRFFWSILWSFEVYYKIWSRLHISKFLIHSILSFKLIIFQSYFLLNLGVYFQFILDYLSSC